MNLVETLLARGARRRVRLFLLGGEPGVGEQAAARSGQRWPGLQVAGVAHGFFSPEDDEGVMAAINQARADLLLVGMGVPRQEIWLDRYWSTWRSGGDRGWRSP